MLAELDINILRFIHHFRLEALDPVLYVLSYATSYVSIGIVLTLLFLSIVRKSKPFRIIFYKMVAVLILAALTSLLIKTAIQRERPFKAYPDIEKLSQAGSSSFPSGHTIEAFAIAMALSLLIPHKRVVIPVFIWAILVAYSRMALGVHYPSDVAGGMVIGVSVGLLVPYLFGIIMKDKPLA
jgi:membrane-associated phospholipid phosphatase